MTELEQIKSDLNDLKAAVLILTDKFSQGIQDIKAASISIGAATQEMKQAVRSSGSTSPAIPDSLVSLPLKVEAVIASQAKIADRLDAVAHAFAQLPMQVEASSAAGNESVKTVVAGVLDEKLAKLAQLEAQLLEQSRANAEKLSALSSKLEGSSGTEDTGGVKEVVAEIAENQNKQNEVLAEVLGAVLDSVAQIKTRVDLIPTAKEMAEGIEKEAAARKLAQGTEENKPLI